MYLDLTCQRGCPIICFQTCYSHSLPSPFLGDFPLLVVRPNIWDSSLATLFLFYPHAIHQEIMLAPSSKYIQIPTVSHFFCHHSGPSQFSSWMFARFLRMWHFQHCSLIDCIITIICVFPPFRMLHWSPYHSELTLKSLLHYDIFLSEFFPCFIHFSVTLFLTQGKSEIVFITIPLWNILFCGKWCENSLPLYSFQVLMHGNSSTNCETFCRWNLALMWERGQAYFKKLHMQLYLVSRILRRSKILKQWQIIGGKVYPEKISKVRNALFLEIRHQKFLSWMQQWFLIFSFIFEKKRPGLK